MAGVVLLINNKYTAAYSRVEGNPDTAGYATHVTTGTPSTTLTHIIYVYPCPATNLQHAKQPTNASRPKHNNAMAPATPCWWQEAGLPLFTQHTDHREPTTQLTNRMSRDAWTCNSSQYQDPPGSTDTTAMSTTPSNTPA